MLNILGAIMVITCTSLLGMYKAQKFASRPRELRSLQSALQILETEIIYGATPLPEAMKQVANRTDKKISLLFNYARNELTSFNGCTVKEAWDKAVDAFSTRTVLDSTDISILKQLGSCLGMSGREDQSKHLHLAMEQLKLETANASEKARTHVKLWNYLGFLSGLLLVFIFY